MQNLESMLGYLEEKYPNKNIIQMTLDDFDKIMTWGKVNLENANVMHLHRVIDSKRRVFLPFIMDGVIYVSGDIAKGRFYIPFRFTDSFDRLTVSIVGYDTLLKTYRTFGRIYGKVAPDTDGTFLFDYDIINTVYEKEVSENGPIDFLSVCAVHAYLVQQDKQVLHTRIEQKRSLVVNADLSKKKPAKRVIHPRYRYVVEIPENYQPRKIENIHYSVDQWTRSGHKTTRWGSIYNAELLAERRNGEVLWETENEGRVKIEFALTPQECHRRVINVAPSTPPKHIYEVTSVRP